MFALSFFQLLFWLFAPGLVLALFLRLPAKLVYPFILPGSVASLALVAIASTFIPGLYRPYIIPFALVPVWVIAYFLGLWQASQNKFTFTSYHFSDLLQFKTLNVLVAALSGAILFGRVFYRSISPVSITPSLWDLQFHNNLTRYIAETGDASPLTVASFATGSPRAINGFYPNGLAFVSALLGKNNVMLAVNLTETIMVAAFGAGLVLLAARMFQSSPLIPWLMVVTMPFFLTFAAKLHATGGRWAYGFGFALTPWVFLLFFNTWEWLNEKRNASTFLTSTITTLAAVLALALGHAAALYLIGFFVIPWTLSLVWQQRKDLTGMAYAGVTVLFSSLITVGLLVYGLRNVGAIKYPQLSLARRALWEGFSAGEMSRWYSGAPEIGSKVVLVLVVLSLIALAFNGPRWLIFSYLLAVAFYFAAVYIEVPYYFLLHPLYNDRTRTASLLSLAGPLLIVGGINAWSQIISSLVKSDSEKPAHAISPLLIISSILCVVSAGALYTEHPDLRNKERFDIVHNAARVENANLVNEPEVELWKKFAQEHPHAGLIGHPSTGSPLIYAATGLKVFPRYTSLVLNHDELELLRHIGDRPLAPKYCELAKKLGVEYIYADSEKYRGGNTGNKSEYTSLDALLENPDQMSVVESGDGVTIYHLDQCSK
ncbi:hypothetical protein BK816_03620 [Boudabousia tangfeifanii]|uniref:Uncharacterized protein n=1 Tax=Boudabousia tangfeifanii TaxID=1912795 RepID=A0A1D9MJL1_9ACTO|nr:DUF6541 family protein [Boudabousia tangfeifanii]AOZ72495.1 hypothetical protein BK816_03620 [Boudabousia tangfeifanii]